MNPYEIEHNIKASESRPRGRRPDMSTFTSHLHQISGDSEEGHTRPHAVPTPVDTSALFRLLQDQLGTLASDAPSEENRQFLELLMSNLELDIAHPPEHIPGVSQEYVDSLDRVSRKSIKDDDSCPICAERYLDDQYCLVVELPCAGRHKFDLECVGPWLRSKGNCPMCRHDFSKKKVIDIPKDEEEDEDDMDGLYG
ncbi:E3 ubiquitin-protein ligase RNF181 [Microdochium nivale]|nr:E3 ubiquitin-protein ligase RNF181 [Microdochium nivale]